MKVLSQAAEKRRVVEIEYLKEGDRKPVRSARGAVHDRARAARYGACIPGTERSTPRARSGSTACAPPGSPTSASSLVTGSTRRTSRTHESLDCTIHRSSPAGSSSGSAPSDRRVGDRRRSVQDRGVAPVRGARRPRRDHRPRATAAERRRRQAGSPPPARHRARSGRTADRHETAPNRRRHELVRRSSLRSCALLLSQTTTRSANGRDSTRLIRLDPRPRACSWGLSRASSTVVLDRHGARASHRSQPSAQPLLEATHLPPLLTTRDERVALRYDVYCASSEAARRHAVRGRRHGFRTSRRRRRVPGDRGARGAEARPKDASWRFVPSPSLEHRPASRTTPCFGATRRT